MATHYTSINDFTKIGDTRFVKHPFFLILTIEDAKNVLPFLPKSISFGFHSIGFKKNLKGYLKYGRKKYDFQEGVLVFTAPNQILSYENLIVKESTGWYVFFDKSLLQKTSLQHRFRKYKFFSYSTHEALHLSKEEENHLNTIFESLYLEYQKPIDLFSKSLIVSHLEMILVYSERYYNRQFIIRNQIETSAMDEFERVLYELCSLDLLQTNGIPSVKHIADKLNLSSNYLSDSIKALTGMTVQKHIHAQMIELAKEHLLINPHSISETAYSLGFQSHTYFSRFFKKIEGLSPKEFLVNNGY